MSEEDSKEKRNQIEETNQQKRDGKNNPLVEKYEGLRKEAIKLLREVKEAKGDWKMLDRALYAIYKQDKEKAFELVGLLVAIRS